MFLLLHYPQGHFDFPKGHVEEHETELQTASRELKEETGISNVKFYDGFREVINYSFRHNNEMINKDVVYFIAETSQTDIVISHEHQGSGWHTYSDTKKKITFDQSRKVLEKAGEFLGL